MDREIEQKWNFLFVLQKYNLQYLFVTMWSYGFISIMFYDCIILVYQRIDIFMLSQWKSEKNVIQDLYKALRYFLKHFLKSYSFKNYSIL